MPSTRPRPERVDVARVGFVVHHDRDQAHGLVEEAGRWLEAEGHDVRLLRSDVPVAAFVERAVDDDEFAAGLDVAVALGGDGTMLRAVDLVARDDVPVLGVNVGQLGYLTEVEPGELRVALDRFLRGDYEIEPRMLLDVAIDAAAGEAAGASQCALNEAVVEKTPTGHTVRLAVSIDGEFFTTYAADGLIVATPTGSTAYAFSARGPIVAPEHRAILLTPVSPHMLFDRTMVLDPDASVRLEVCGHRTATVSVDGRNLGTLGEGDAIVCTAATHTARLVTYGKRNFHAILKQKFGLNDR
jgi:NAD+ kinase